MTENLESAPAPDTRTQEVINHRTPKKRDGFNDAKLKVLAACMQLDNNHIEINSVRVGKLIQKKVNTTCMLLQRMSLKNGYLSRKIDKNTEDGCSVKYHLTKKGRHIFKRLSIRHKNGMDLNLKSNPSGE